MENVILHEPRFLNEVIPIVVIPNFLSTKECEAVINSLDLLDVVYAENEAFNVKNEISAKTFFLNFDNTRELHNKVYSKIFEIARDNYKLKDVYTSEALYVSEYLKGGFRSLHADGGYMDKKINYPNEIVYKRMLSRKLTAVIQLSDKSTYDGGDLEIPYWTIPGDHTKQGSMILFPTSFLHQVSKVKSGIRYSLIAFACQD